MSAPFESLDVVNLTASGTAQQITSTPTYATSAFFECPIENTGNIYLGGANVDTGRAPIKPGRHVQYVDPDGVEFNLSDFYIDGDTTNDDLHVWFTRKPNRGDLS
jgi:hypothetical protein|tara:strand:- start:281 stop:595 length:315 start_codon:yes stop_codon:yes gene_type:complete